MAEADQPPYLYLTTIGRKSGKPHNIEIWFVQREDRCYLVAEGNMQPDWVQNIIAHPEITFSIGSRDAQLTEAAGRVVDPAQEPEVTAAVKALMEAKYQWSEGLIVELKPKT